MKINLIQFLTLIMAFMLTCCAPEAEPNTDKNPGIDNEDGDGTGNNDNDGDKDDDKDKDTVEIKEYVVGQKYQENGKVTGVVFYVSKPSASAIQSKNISGQPFSDGDYAMVVSLDETEIEWSVAADVLDLRSDNGAENCTAIVAQNPQWSTQYPALKWCADKNGGSVTNDGWYLPSHKELEDLFLSYYSIPQGKTLQQIDLEKKNAFDSQFTEGGGTAISATNTRANKHYWSSNCYDRTYAPEGMTGQEHTFQWAFACNWGILADFNAFVDGNVNKENIYFVRAVKRIGVK